MTCRHFFACTAVVLVAGSAQAQFVKGNEAVHQSKDGARRVETPPITNSAASFAPCAATAGCSGGAWLMVETNGGLVECTEPYARPSACRTATYGTSKLLRVWVVKVRGKWMQCQLPDISSKCVEMFARPPANLVVAVAQ